MNMTACSLETGTTSIKLPLVEPFNAYICNFPVHTLSGGGWVVLWVTFSPVRMIHHFPSSQTLEWSRGGEGGINPPKANSR